MFKQFPNLKQQVFPAFPGQTWIPAARFTSIRWQTDCRLAANVASCTNGEVNAGSHWSQMIWSCSARIVLFDILHLFHIGFRNQISINSRCLMSSRWSQIQIKFLLEIIHIATDIVPESGALLYEQTDDQSHLTPRLTVQHVPDDLVI